MTTLVTTRVAGNAQAIHLQRVSGAAARNTRDRVPTLDRRAWTFRAHSFAARSFIAPMLPLPPIGGTRTTRVVGV